MKFILVLIICSGIRGECLDPHQWPKKYDTMYECLQAGYHHSSAKLKEMGPDNVNKLRAHIKFYCQEITET